MFPSIIAGIDLSSEEATAIETFQATFEFSHWERVL
jgi:hypothetical protein